jgi:preprotein translocase subunit YajC
MQEYIKKFSEGDVILIFSGLFGILEEIGNSCLEISDEQKTATSFIFSNLYEMTPELVKKIAEKWREIKLINFL